LIRAMKGYIRIYRNGSPIVDLDFATMKDEFQS